VFSEQITTYKAHRTPAFTMRKKFKIFIIMGTYLVVMWMLNKFTPLLVKAVLKVYSDPN
jgi:hypothetical protein